LGAFAIIAACSQHVGISKWKRRRLVVAPQKRPKLAVADATGELHTIEQFGRPLGIKNNSDLADLQIGSKHVIFIAPLKRGRFEVRYGEARDVLLVSRQPLLDTARLLIRVGCRPDAIIAMRRRTSISDDLRAPLGVAAKYTVDETKTVFAKWKPFSQSAVVRVDAPTRKSVTDTAATTNSSGKRGRRRADHAEPENLGPIDSEQIRS
jgi:hypothetical protein